MTIAWLILPLTLLMFMRILAVFLRHEGWHIFMWILSCEIFYYYCFKVVVYFRIRVVDDQTGNITSFEAGNKFDTFEPDLWLWATSKGKNLLRVPLDFKVLSFGLLGINLAYLNIDVEKTSADCLVASPSDEVINTIASFLANNVTGNGSALTTDGPIICRSAFAFSHNLFGERGIGIMA